MKCYVSKHYKTNKANMFFYSNKDYKVVFKDLTELIVSEKRYVTYVNKVGDRRQFAQGDAEKQPEEIKKRIDYATNAVAKLAGKSRTNDENQNPANAGGIIRSSSVCKVEKPNHALIRGSASTTRLIGFRGSR